MPISERGDESPMDFTLIPASKSLSFASLSSNIYKTSFEEVPTPKISSLPSPLPMETSPPSTSLTLSSKLEEKQPPMEKIHPHETSSFHASSTLSYHILLPYIMSGYLQLFFNAFLICLILYLTLQFIKTVRRDVELKVEEYKTIILNEIAQCSKQYLENRCHPNERVPAIDKACNSWYQCMNRDPTEISWTKISAETIAEIINGFVEPISYKTMIFFILLTFGLLFISNLAFSLVKHRTQSIPDTTPSTSLPLSRKWILPSYSHSHSPSLLLKQD
jgi:hypothetical protein